MEKYCIEKVVLSNNYEMVVGESFHGFTIVKIEYFSTLEEADVHLDSGKYYKILRFTRPPRKEKGAHKVKEVK